MAVMFFLLTEIYEKDRQMLIVLLNYSLVRSDKMYR